MNTNKGYSPEVRERAVRLVFESQTDGQSQWGTIQSIADKIGCTHETLRRWVRQRERDEGLRAGLSSDDRDSRVSTSIGKRGQPVMASKRGVDDTGCVAGEQR